MACSRSQGLGRLRPWTFTGRVPSESEAKSKADAAIFAQIACGELQAAGVQAVQSGGRHGRGARDGRSGEQPRTRGGQRVGSPGLVSSTGLVSRGSDATGGSCKTGFAPLGLARMARMGSDCFTAQDLLLL